MAGVTVRVDSEVDFRDFNDFGFYRDFIVPGGEARCRLRHLIAGPPDTAAGDSFATQNWEITSSDGKQVLRVGPASGQGKADNVVVFDSDYSSGTMYQDSVFELFRRFIDQFLIINLLAADGGFLLHASGVVWEGKGICFAGRSGTGKSTLLNLFKDELPREALLNDDRLAVRKCGGEWRVFGTPWYGESRVSSSGSAPLSSLFFIRHAEKDTARALPASEVCPHLMVLGLLPLWDREATSRVISTFEDLIRCVPAFDLGFVPGKGAVDLIKKTI